MKKYYINDIITFINKLKLGEVIDSNIIHEYIEYLHGSRDFINGKLPKRIHMYEKYELVNSNISDLNINEYYLFDDLVDRYSKQTKKTGYYPPIVISHENKIIDGNHRSNALNSLGIKHIKSLKGIK